MDRTESASHSVWDCKYHVAFIAKCGRKALYVELRPHLREVLRRLMRDHVHMQLSIPPKYAVSEVVGYIGARVRFTCAEEKQQSCIA